MTARTGYDGEAGEDPVSRVVSLGEKRALEGFTLAGVELIPAETPEEARAGFSRLDPGVAVVILTRASRDAVADLLEERQEVIWTVLPD
jgi:vacuolar-type H+-ATPase subunit F/Vma7